ncbi:hypothetical protein ACLB2K_039670 [Fragaria x ananassa]
MATYRALLSLKSSLDDPDSRLSTLSALRLLNLSNNVFNRTFPPELSNLTNLRVLDLYNNNLTGVLPVSVVTFHCIKVLDRLGEAQTISLPTLLSLPPDFFPSSLPCQNFQPPVRPLFAAALVPIGQPLFPLPFWTGGSLPNAAVREKLSLKVLNAQSSPSLELPPPATNPGKPYMVLKVFNPVALL